ncbi:MAG: ribonuclease H-like YkuK family protein [Bacteroidota bacterium]|nr:ribonuclease H-like YkuK family protein [Bacteroidota bacterium]
MKWRRLNGEPVRQEISDEVEQILARENREGFKLKVCIGTDSQVTGLITEFATVIVFVRPKHGGFMLISSEKTKKIFSLKERMIEEVSRSIQIAYHICPLLDKYQVDLEVHADINTNPQFKSNTALSEAMGYILGMGFVFKAKPEAFASTYCANKIVH